MMRAIHKILAVFLSQILILMPLGCGPKCVEAPEAPLAPAVFDPLQEALRKHYAELFEIAPRLEFSAAQIQRMREYLETAEDYCVDTFRARADQYEAQARDTQSQLRRVSARVDEERRKELHCRIQNARVLHGQAEVLASQGIPVAYQNKQAKLDLIEKWPAELRKIRQEIAAGAHHNRRWADSRPARQPGPDLAAVLGRENGRFACPAGADPQPRERHPHRQRRYGQHAEGAAAPAERQHAGARSLPGCSRRADEHRVPGRARPHRRPERALQAARATDRGSGRRRPLPTRVAALRRVIRFGRLSREASSRPRGATCWPAIPTWPCVSSLTMYASDARYQKALALDRLGQPKQASEELNRLIREHPNSDAARLANDRLRRAKEPAKSARP